MTAMAASPLTAARWQIESGTACLLTSKVSASITLDRPAWGLQQLRVDDHPLDRCELLGVIIDRQADLPSTVSDCFNREGDLVVTYDQVEQRPARIQAYWRCGQPPAPPPGTLFTCDLHVSTQTDLLDSWPALATRSVLTAVQAQQLDGDGNWRATINAPSTANLPLGFSLTGAAAALRYVEMLHPDDAREFAQPTSVRPLSDGRLELSHQLFGTRMEKGVIRRARLRGLLLPAAIDGETILSAYRAWADYAPPLTT